ncbi:MAG: ABC transporter ATP-binding protein [Candidatus Aminicenantales bacterium]
MLRLFKLTLRERKWLVLALLSTVFVALFTYLFVNIVQPVMDEMFQLAPQKIPEKMRVMDLVFKYLHVSKDELHRVLPFLVVIVIFGKGIFTFFSTFFMKIIGNKSVKRLRDELYSNMLYQSTNFFDHTMTGDLMSRLTNDVDKIQQAVSGSMGDLIEEIFILCALVVSVFIIDWHLALVSFVIAPLAVIPLAAFSRQLKRKGLMSQVKMAQIYNLIFETITGNKIVKAFTMEQFELKKFFQATWSYFRINIKLAWIASLSSPFMEFMGGVASAFILFVGSSRISQGHISPGDFGSFVIAIFMMYTPIKRLSRANIVIQQAIGCHERIQEVMKSAPQIRDHPQAYPMPSVKGKIKFDDVCFSYNETRPVLFDINFEVMPNEMIAIVGLSGAGKTTIINLLARFYDPTSGRISIDGIDIREVTLASLRAQIGLVTQDIILFNDTVRNNIAYGLDKVPFGKVIAAAKASECHGFIQELPQGYDTFIGEKGGLLSSGQRQRLAIARALLKDPPILILDEATSSLDSESERLIQTALSHIMKGRTTFVIAHRLSTIRNADEILVIDKGMVVETGTHDKLIRKDGIYRKLHDLQFPEVKEVND